MGDVFAGAIEQAIARELSVQELIRNAEALSDRRSAVQALYATWIQHNRDNPLQHLALFNYAVTLADNGAPQAARDCLEDALRFAPDFLPARINLGRLREGEGQLGQAVVEWGQVMEMLAPVTGPHIGYKVTALLQTARVLEAASQDAPAEELLRQAIELDSRQRDAIQHYLALRQRQCEWPVVQPTDRVDRATLMGGMSPLSAAAHADDPLLQLGIAWHYNKLDVGAPVAEMPSTAPAEAHAGRLRIGYLSSDLREHAVGHLMAEVLGLHDREQVEVFAYYCGPAGEDPLQKRFLATTDHWIPITGMDDATAARRIAADGIQILVDVNGYTRDGRTRLVALRPAPVIINWLGFPGTTGSPYHHYIIADDVIIPPQDERFFSERVLRLPCYQPNDRQRLVAEGSPDRAAAGLPAKGTVFCCFNGTHKITRFVFARWMEILRGVPGSVLWLLEAGAATEARLREAAAAQGVAAERIVFAPKLAHAQHLARYRLADLFLDTNPYGAHTTASDALWMGVPVLTMRGRSFAARVCSSLVSAAGVPELVADGPGEYVAQAIALGADRAQLQALAARILAGRDSCTLFDTPRLVRGLEALYRQAWAEFQAGALPRPDLANLDVVLEVGSAVDHDALDLATVEDYPGWWRALLARRAAYRPIPPGGRLDA